MVLMYDTSSNCALQLYEVSFKIAVTERRQNSIANDQREIAPKLCKAEIWFLHTTHRLIVLHNCMKFHPKSMKSFQLTEWTQNCIY